MAITRRGALAGIAGIATLPAPALAQAFPSRTMTLVVPFPAGGPADVFGRLLAKGMSERLGQSVVVDNKTGVAGVTGVDFVAKSAPDGHVFGLGSPSALTLMPQLLATIPYDASKDLAPITLVTRVQEVLGVYPGLGTNTVVDLVAKAKAEPGKINYGSAGLGGITHLAGELFKREAGIEILHVPYRGAAPAVVDLLAGRVQMAILDITAMLAHFRSGALKPLMMTSAKRSPLLPDVPSAVEAGFPKVISDNWYALLTPSGVPAAARARLNAAAVETLKQKEVIDAFAAQGGLVDPGTSETAIAHIAEERARWSAIIKAANIKIE
jgi:tripartite-type tricarboxylate transporter receptor subunit TctC